MAARFGEMLLNRRRQMGLSIQQVANTIKIRPQIIEFFENGDFSSMPPRGYAQGMISSYARYLGLNPREVVNAYFDDLRAYESQTDRTGGRLQDAAGYVSPRSASTTGRFMMVDPPRSRYAQRPPQAGYVSESSSGHEPMAIARTPQAPRMPQSRRPQGYGTSRDRYAGTPAPLTGSRNAPRPRDAALTQQMRPVRSDQRRPHPSERGQGARGQDARRSVPSRGRAPQRRGSYGGRGSAPTGDNRVLLALLIAAVAIIVLLIVLVVRGCSAPAESQTPANPQVSAGSVSTTTGDGDTSDSSTEGDSNGSSSEEGADAAQDGTATSDDAAAEGTDSATAVPQETVVRVSVADGESSWLEIRLDGSVVYGDEAYGPFEQEYTVTDSIRITANTPGSVTVTQNGKEVRWDTSTSGVARITISAPEPVVADAQAADGTAADGTSTAEDATEEDGASAA